MAEHGRPHGQGVRGLENATKSVLFEGAFGRMFRSLPAADFGDDDDKSQKALEALGTAMVADFDAPKDGPDDEESGIPAAYTYLGQFIDHDLTFDPASSLQRQNDADALVDFRTPRFDLDCVYGRGASDQPYMYDGKLFLLSDRMLKGAGPNAPDLPRARNGRAIIGDPRNDENVVVSQLQGLWLRFHNFAAGQLPNNWSLEAVQREVRFHYQWMVLTDFLPTIVSHDVLDAVWPHRTEPNILAHPPKLQFYNPKEDMFMPLEFSAAAYRFGHSMVRPGYRLNDAIGPLPIFDPAGTPGTSLRGFGQFPDTWALDWGRFVDRGPRPFGDQNNPGLEGNKKRLQLAYRIDTSLVNPLGTLPPQIASDPPPSLATRNLLRGWRMRLPSGQAVAHAMGVKPLDDAEIKIGKFTGDPKDVKDILTATGNAGKGFAGNCPLWTYILAETKEVELTVKTLDGDKRIKTRRLGPVGGRIVAETFIGILSCDRNSFLNQDPLWRPRFGDAGNTFGLRQLVERALQL
jgi:Animal haem peroxidase